ncbi:folate family ECF transporter S component [Fusibacter bizertensis]
MQENKQKVRQKNIFGTSVIVKAALLATISIVLTRFLSLMLMLGGLPALRVGFGSIPLIMSGMMFGPVIGGITGIVADLVGYMINPMGGTFFPGFTLSAALYGVIAGILFKNIKIQNMKINFNLVNAIVMVLFGIGLFIVMLTTNTLVYENGKLIMNDTSALPIIVLMFLVTALFIMIPFAMSSRFKKEDNKLNFDKIAFAVNITYVVNALLLNTLWLSILYDKGFMVFLPGRVIAAVVTIPIYTLIIFTLGKFVNLLEP